MHNGLRILAATAALALAATPAHAAVRISSAATQNMSCSGGVCAPTARNAILNAGDLENLLASGNVTVTTTGTGVQANNIEVRARVSWSDGSVLTLDAYRSIAVWRPVSVTGMAGMTLVTDDGGSGGSLFFFDRGKITFQNLSSALAINGTRYRLENDLKRLAYDVARHPNGAYALVKDYDAQGDGVYPDSPIDAPFRGSFTGLGNSINNLVVVNDSDFANVGLFATVNRHGAVSNIGLRKVIIEGRNLNCNIGGIAGTSAGLIENSYVSGRIGGGGDTCITGGVAGVNRGAIVGDRSAGRAKGVAVPVGGLVGYNEGAITNSWSSDMVAAGSDSEAVGGLVGYNYGGRIRTSYSTGQVIARNALIPAGGFVGASDSSGRIRESYSTGMVKGSGSVGGFAGNEQGTAEHDYWDTTTSGTEIGVGTGSSSGITGLTTAQFQSGLPAGFDPKVWAENPNINGGLPYLLANPPPK